ncbi:MAG: Zn-dependent metalloprotease [Alteromonadaceae bacterium]|jgi:Zn-dependent metalloprotease
MYKNYQNVKLSLAIGAALLASSIHVSAIETVNMTIKNKTLKGSPSFVTGNLASMTQQTAVEILKEILASQPEYRSTGDEDFTIKRQWVDELGKTHTHFDQTINGITVYGTSMIMHANPANGVVASHDVYGLTGNLAVDSTPANSLVMTSNHDNGIQAMGAAQLIGSTSSEPELVYIYLATTDETKLAWKIEVSYDNGDDFGRDILFYDLNNGQLLETHPQIHSAKSRKSYTLDNQSQSNAPGRLLCTNNQSCGDASAQRAHDGASVVYDYYQSRFGRDGINNSGMTMVSSVHMGNRVNNAYWTGSQMLYGDGDGQRMTDLTKSFEVIGHELTHGVTQHTGGMVYRNESGALNEAWSDILGVASKAYRDGTTQLDWSLGTEIWTPGTPGDAMRYMNNPTQDGQSKDYYPERYTGTQDNGGVHLNSGIANLAFVLLVDGGSHPRNKTSAQVSAIGVAKAEKIFYRALSTYLTQNSNFASARTATAQAAQDLYGAADKKIVETAWCAVGVGACPDVDTGTVIKLTNGVAKTGIGASAKKQLIYSLEVPNGATDLNFVTNGGSGDADLYVKYGSQPTLNSADCKSTTPNNDESCSITNVQVGTYYVMVEAWSAISGVSLTGSYSDGGTTTPDPINDTLNNISVNSGQWQHYTQELVVGYTSMTVTLSGGSGDTDLYLRHGSQSTSTLFDCKSDDPNNSESCTINAPAAGTWYIDLYGYANSSGITLNLTATP